MATKALKGVSEEKWAQFKAIAAERDMSMAALFEKAVDAVKKDAAESRWKAILANRIRHTPEEWKEFEKKAKEFRHSLKMRSFA